MAKPAPDGPQILQKLAPVSRETEEKLILYAALLEKWQKSQNLVSPQTIKHLWRRHMADSLQLLDYGLSDGPWIDLGSGAGFPGLVIAIAGQGRAGHHVHLVESNQGKCAFLAEVKRATDAPATIHPARVENCGDILPGINKTITARALAPLHRLCSYVKPMLTGESIALFPKGRNARAEIEMAKQKFTFDFKYLQSKLDPEGVILRFSRIECLKD
jgi:16S rRNA (guanine527-N7)-methyltransferase